MPILRNTHSSASQPPVTMAIIGILPSVRLLGMSKVLSGTVLAAHGLAMVTGTRRRQRPSWITTVMLPAGTFLSVKLPSAALYSPAGGSVAPGVEISGEPAAV